MQTTLKNVTDDAAQKKELIYLAEDDESKAAKLLLQLSDANYAVRLFNQLSELSTALKDRQPPAAIILNTAFRGNDSAGIAAITKLKQDGQTLPPVIFIASDDSMATRLAAVRAGGQHFLTEPLDTKALFSVLDHALADTKKSAPCKVLVVDTAAAQLRYYNEVLNDERLSLRTLSQPLDILRELDIFNADVIVISVNLSDCTGLELAQVIRQNGASAHTPIIFLYGKADEGLHLEATNAGGDAFFSKTMKPEHLVEAILAKAKRARSEKQLDQQLQFSLDRSEFYHFAMDQHNIVSITDIGGRITDVNDKFCTISGYRREELIGQNHRLIKSGHHDEDLYEDMWRTISAGKVWHGEICNHTKRGHEYWASSTIVPFLDRKGDPGNTFLYAPTSRL